MVRARWSGLFVHDQKLVCLASYIAMREDIGEADFRRDRGKITFQLTVYMTEFPSFCKRTEQLACLAEIGLFISFRLPMQIFNYVKATWL